MLLVLGLASHILLVVVMYLHRLVGSQQLLEVGPGAAVCCSGFLFSCIGRARGDLAGIRIDVELLVL